MRLFVIADYHCRDVHHARGAVLEVPADVAVFFLADAPGCFSLRPPGSVSVETAEQVVPAEQEVPVVQAEVPHPPADRMLRNSSSVRKGRTK